VTRKTIQTMRRISIQMHTMCRFASGALWIMVGVTKIVSPSVAHVATPFGTVGFSPTTAACVGALEALLGAALILRRSARTMLKFAVGIAAVLAALSVFAGDAECGCLGTLALRASQRQTLAGALLLLTSGALLTLRTRAQKTCNLAFGDPQ